MALAQHRVVLVGETPHAHEREAIQLVLSELPNNDPYLAWELTELLDASTGRLYEIDLLVLGYSALYLVEIKSGPGTYKGDSVDWYRDVAGEPAHYMECPYRLANHKAKVLASLLHRKLGIRAPYVQPLIFLSHPEAKLDLRVDGRTAVVTRKDIARALKHHDFPNRDPGWRGDPIRAPVMRDLARALGECGVRPRKGKLYVGPYELGELLGEGSGYQDRAARHRTMPNMRRRARIYLVPQETSVERRQALRRAADREAQLLHELREHAGILRIYDYVEDAPLGPTVLFDAFEGATRLDAFIRQNPDLPFEQRVALIEQVGRALGFCHRKEILHGGLNPEAVLVARQSDRRLDARLFNFQLASATDRVEPTAHVSAWATEPALVYRAPELRQDPSARTPQSDIFSLGALAYFVLTGQPPAADVLAVDDRLRASGSLDPRAADDRVPADVAELIRIATNVSWTQRFDSADEWVQFLLDAATSPEPASKPVFADPLAAGPDDRLSADLVCQGTLGQGASARVLRVRRESDDGEYALKVSLSAEHDERIRAEGQALGRFRHPRIVEKLADLELGGRACLLLTIAGTETLQRRLQQHGSVPLDYALRWGDDLLHAIEYLEEQEITHRDIKPANLGIGSSGKRANHLTLFDFSLVLTDPKMLDAGTAAYRDPFLRSRGAWDAAADRWSAAVTLHEMLTGVRPSYGGTGGTAVDPKAPLVLAAERFDAGVRDRLVRFFTKALARDGADRFANAEEMRHAWSACFHERAAGAAAEAPEAGAESPPPAPQPVSDEDLRRIGPDAPLDTLPLSVRAKNALDRAGVARARDLLKLPDNRLSAIRGVGQLVAREIHELRGRWAALQTASDQPATPFFAGYRGEDLALGATTLDERLAHVLADAGLRTLTAVASAPEEQIATLGRRHAFDPTAVRAVLDHEHRSAEERDHPVTLEGWRDALFPARKRGNRPAVAAVVRILFGIEAPKSGVARLPVGASANDAASASGTTTANVYLALGRCRELWAGHPAIGELSSLTRAIVDEASGAVPLRDAAERLLLRMPYDRSRGQDDVLAEAAAVLRATAEIDHGAESGAGITFVRIHDVLWLCASTAHGTAVRDLAHIADELAERTPLASAPETQAALQRAAEGTPLATLPVERLATLAARASQRAACSTRLEMYPRAMPAHRAIELTAAVLTSAHIQLTPDEVRKRIADRYPDAAPPPDRPALDALLAPFGLTWDGEKYVRPGEEVRVTHHSTRFSTLDRAETALPTEVLASGPDAVEAREFDARLVQAVERKQLRLLLVRSDLASRATARLVARLRVPARRVDRLLIDAMERRALDDGVDQSVLHEAHQAGDKAADWANLTGLAQDAIGDVARALLPAREPLLLTHLGLVERYRLQSFLDALAEASRSDDCEAIFLLVPSHDTAGSLALRGISVPGLLPSQRLWISKDWIENRHNAAAPAA